MITIPEIRDRTLSIEAALLGSWAALGVAAGFNFGEYTSQGLLLVAAAVVVMALAIAGYRDDKSKAIGSEAATTGAFVVAAFGSVYFPAGIYGHGVALVLCRGLTVAVATTVILSVALKFDWDRALVWASLGAMVGAGVGMIVSSPHPAIDDWFMLQAVTSGLSHGANIYTLHWSSGYPSFYSNGFVYLPGAAAFLWPFHLLFGDVRYGLLAATAATSLILIRMTPSPRIRLTILLIFLYPGALFGLEQSWIDPLVALGIVGTIAFVTSRRYPLAILTFAAALTIKQTAWVLIPLAMFWKDFGLKRTLISVVAAFGFIAPWFIDAPTAFIREAIKYNLYLPNRSDSLSLYALAAQHGLHPSPFLVGGCATAAIGFAMWRLPRTKVGFAIGVAFAMTSFNLVDKLSFFNEWAIAAELIVVAVVVHSSQQSGWRAGLSSHFKTRASTEDPHSGKFLRDGSHP